MSIIMEHGIPQLLIRLVIGFNLGGGTGLTPWGQMYTTGEEELRWLQEKKNQEVLNQEMKLGSYLIDEKRPESQDRAFELYPELKEYPESYRNQNLYMQEALATILRDGKLTNREDNRFLQFIFRPDTELPLTPLWDPEGVMLAGAVKQPSFLKALPEYLKLGLFSPRKYSASELEANKILQQKIKIMIARRVYPGLRDKEDDYIIKDVLSNRSPLAMGGVDQIAGAGAQINDSVILPTESRQVPLVGMPRSFTSDYFDNTNRNVSSLNLQPNAI